MGSQTNIQAALNTHLQAFDGSITISWPNTKFNPTHPNLFLRPTLIPANNVLDTLNRTFRRQGIYQIDIFVPIDTGTYDVTELMDSLESHFNVNSLDANGTTVYIQAISKSSLQRQDAWYVGYVQVNYLSFS